MRGGGQFDYHEDDDSNAQYGEYEEFDDEYLGEVHIVSDDGPYTAHQARTPLVNVTDGYSSFSYAATKPKSGTYYPSPYAEAKPSSGGYSPLSYAAVKAKSVRVECTSYDDAEPRSEGYSSLSYGPTNGEYTSSTTSKPKQPKVNVGNSSSYSYKHCGQPSKASPTQFYNRNAASGPRAGDGSGKIPKNKHNKTEFSHALLGKPPERYGTPTGIESDRSLSPEPSKSRNKPGKSSRYSNDQERSRKPEARLPQTKHTKSNVRFQDQSESPPSRPKHPPKSTRPSREERCDTPTPIEEPPPNHYAILEISPSASPETSVDVSYPIFHC